MPSRLIFVLIQVLGLFLEPLRGEVYVVLMRDEPVVSYKGSIPGYPATDSFSGTKVDVTSQYVELYRNYLIKSHNMVLQNTLQKGTYSKLYSYHHLVNGFAVETNSTEAAERLAVAEGVRCIQKDTKIEKLTTHTPDFLGISSYVWPLLGGARNSGEGVVIGMIDSGIDPIHPSFSNSQFSEGALSRGRHNPKNRHRNYTGKCEVAKEFPKGSCNGKIIGAQHFDLSIKAAGQFNVTADSASPFDTGGHGSHTASTAAGNHGVPVTVNGFNYGFASGMAPGARIAVYKAIYSMGGYLADVVAAIDQAVEDGVDILSLSIGPSSISSDVSAFLDVLDVELLYAVKAGVFVVQAGGNNGPVASSVLSFSPWISTVAASLTDRTYNNFVELGNGQKYAGLGLSPPTKGESVYYRMVTAMDAFDKNSSYSGVNTCQYPEAFIKKVVEGNILICSYTIDFDLEVASITTVSDTAQKLGAAGFVMTVDPTFGSLSFRSGPVIFTSPGTIVLDEQSSLNLLTYYSNNTRRDASGSVVEFGATARIGDGRIAAYSGQGPTVASYSSRGPDLNNKAGQFADVLKPNIMAPGHLIWAAWSPTSVDDKIFQEQNFAMVSGTSMATPHVAGVAAMIKQNHPDWSPAAISSAMMTTASTADRLGKPILAQSPWGNISAQLGNLAGAATQFDYGAGLINPARAMDPGLVFDADFDDYMSFLCSLPGVDEASVREATGMECSSRMTWASDLNTASITVGNLMGSRKVHRVVKNVAADYSKEVYEANITEPDGVKNVAADYSKEVYEANITEPDGVKVKVKPRKFTIHKGSSKSLLVTLKVKMATGTFVFGEIVLTGNRGHLVSIPLAVCPTSVIG
eukprot:PITA_00911